MKLKNHLVIGAGGLLGRSVVARLQADGEQPFTAKVAWDDLELAAVHLEGALRLVAAEAGSVVVYWCAGAGISSTPAEALNRELQTFESFLRSLGHAVDEGLAEFSLFLASSVGGVYAGSHPAPFSESTEPVPLTPYGHTKFAMESMAAESAATFGFSLLVGRITNIYGPNQNPDKPQGLISVVARCLVNDQPVPIFVPLETTRDYLYADDCAALIIAGMERLAVPAESAPHQVTKILAHGDAVTVDQVLDEFRRAWPRPVRTMSSSASAAGQASDLRVRSITWTELDVMPRTSLTCGVRRVLESAASPD
jgi:UDP-glucose 4-epimerase